ncbi:unnamed protein product [Protopolystoma xenopodis]|uniref:Uncharacterized protein n=1 Tax=Protopolystoma xenopodis TaxID=117903 RepID=A0A448XE45_9PLAT|nr:unnamed protein product [Protopolystoma xenopodis]
MLHLVLMNLQQMSLVSTSVKATGQARRGFAYKSTSFTFVPSHPLRSTPLFIASYPSHMLSPPLAHSTFCCPLSHICIYVCLPACMHACKKSTRSLQEVSTPIISRSVCPMETSKVQFQLKFGQHMFSSKSLPVTLSPPAQAAHASTCTLANG